MNISSRANIDANAVIAADAVVGPGAYVGEDCELEQGVRIGANAALIAERKPGSAAGKRLIVRRGATVGVNASVVGGVEIGAEATVGAGAVVTSDVPPRAIVVGVPAHIVGYNSLAVQPRTSVVTSHKSGGAAPLSGGARLIELPLVKDLRGDLCFGEIGKHLPFTPHRFFVVFSVPSRKVRGEHAHKRCAQFLVCTSGHLSVVVDDGGSRDEVLLDRPSVGLLIPPMVWGTQYKHSSDACLLVLASEVYDASDYIRDYDEFLSAKQQSRA